MTHHVSSDGVDHGAFVLSDCIWAVVHRCEDGYTGCPLLDSGNWTCEECMDILNERIEKEERADVCQV